MEGYEELGGIDLYEFLGVDHTASDKEIRKAYRKASLTCHPDKNPSQEAAVKFHTLSLVLEVLTRADLRKEYDLKLKAKLESIKRNSARDAERRKMQEDLETRERNAFVDRKEQSSLDLKLEMLKQEALRKKESYKHASNESLGKSTTNTSSSNSMTSTGLTTKDNSVSAGDKDISLRTVKLTLRVSDPSLKPSSSKSEIVAQLREYLKEYGTVDSLVVTEKSSGSKPKAYKYVALAHFNTADMAIRAVSGLENCRSPLFIVESIKRLGLEPTPDKAKAPPINSASYRKSTLDRLRGLSSKTADKV